MSNLGKIKPINTKVLFQFVEDIDNSAFTGKTKGGLYVVENEENQINRHRWGKVLAIGPEVPTSEVDVGDFILMEPLGWTNHMSLSDNPDEEKFWFTDLEKIILVGDEPYEIGTTSNNNQ